MTQGHFDDVYGVAVIPSSVLKADVLTAGVDGVLCKFSSELRRPVWKLYLKVSTGTSTVTSHTCWTRLGNSV